MTLTPHQIQIVKSTAPVLATHGLAITTDFYNRLLKNHPTLTNTFNATHLTTGAQPSALAHAVLAYASNIDNLGALTAAVSRIGHKHASLGVSPDQYPVVGENLIASIKEVLGDGVDEEVLDAWRAAYKQLADVFVGFEKDLYCKAEATPGGWTGWRKFVVARKIRETERIVSFYLTPSDNGSLPAYKPGQYISIRCFVPELGVYQPRQYSLSDAANGTTLRISVKRELATESKPAGQISNMLHESLSEGSELDVSMPFGTFTVDTSKENPTVLISAGVGITPMISMLNAIVSCGKPRPVLFIHSARNRKAHVMNAQVLSIMQENPWVSRAVFYQEVCEGDVEGVDYDFVGRVDLKVLSFWEHSILGCEYFVCGPGGFMDGMAKGLEGLGVRPGRIHREVFGVA